MAGADTSKEDDVLDDAKESYTLAFEAWSDNYEHALDDFRFARLHEHWPEKLRKARELNGQPCLVIPKLPAFIRQVVNEGRQNKPGIIVYPVDSGADPETAEIFNGLIRHIEQFSGADVAYDTALEHAVTGGFGWFKINTKYRSDDSFEQDIVVEAVPNPFSIVGDPAGTGADSSDWNLAFEIDSLTERAFKARWKDAEPVSFDGRGVRLTPVRSGDNVQVAVHWAREETTRAIVAVTPPAMDGAPQAMDAADALLNDNLVIGLDVFEKNLDLFQALGVAVIGQPRNVPSFKVTQRILSGADVLEEIPWAGKFIPIVPVYGEDINIEGRRHLSGLVRAAKDTQRNFDYWRSAATELMALAPKTPFIGPLGAFKTDAKKWASANTESHAFIEYDPVAGAQAPQRQAFAGLPAGAIQEAMNASDDMKAIMGLYNASLGAQGNETSGRAILARQHEGDVSTFHFIDNMSRAVRHGGRIMVDLIPKVYSTPRVIRVLGNDGVAKPVQINAPFREPVTDPAGQPVQEPRLDAGGQPMCGPDGAPMTQLKEIERIYALDAGRYDLVVKAGPSFATKREEFVQLASELIRAYPPLAPILADMIVKNYDIPDADEIVQRIQAMNPQTNPELAQAKQQIGQMGEALKGAQQHIAALSQGNARADQELQIDAFNAETNRLKALEPKGLPVDASQIMPLVLACLQQIIGEADPTQPQPMAGAAGGLMPPRPPAPPMAPDAGPPPFSPGY